MCCGRKATRSSTDVLTSLISSFTFHGWLFTVGHSGRVPSCTSYIDCSPAALQSAHDVTNHCMCILHIYRVCPSSTTRSPMGWYFNTSVYRLFEPIDIGFRSPPQDSAKYCRMIEQHIGGECWNPQDQSVQSMDYNSSLISIPQISITRVPKFNSDVIHEKPPQL